LDVWNNHITLIKAAATPILSSREKMPLEVTPVAIYLKRFSH
jgi:hypothetical protein